MTSNINTDAEILAHYRQANPYISLALAKELHHIERKFRHLGRIKMQQERQTREQDRRKVEDLVLMDRSEDE